MHDMVNVLHHVKEQASVMTWLTDSQDNEKFSYWRWSQSLFITISSFNLIIQDQQVPLKSRGVKTIQHSRISITRRKIDTTVFPDHQKKTLWVCGASVFTIVQVAPSIFLLPSLRIMTLCRVKTELNRIKHSCMLWVRVQRRTVRAKQL